MYSLKDFKDIHKGKFILICCAGASINNIPVEVLQNTITIGNSDIERVGFIPNYIVYLEDIRTQLNGKKKFPKYDRIDYFLNAKCENIFAYNRGYPLVVKYMEDYQKDKIISMPAEYFMKASHYNKNNVYHVSNSSFVATSLAVYMGASVIGLIGVDFNGGKNGGYCFENKYGDGTDHLNQIFEMLNGSFKRLADFLPDITFINFNPDSRIDAFPKRDIFSKNIIEEFGIDMAMQVYYKECQQCNKREVVISANVEDFDRKITKKSICYNCFKELLNDGKDNFIKHIQSKIKELQNKKNVLDKDIINKKNLIKKIKNSEYF